MCAAIYIYIYYIYIYIYACMLVVYNECIVMNNSSILIVLYHVSELLIWPSA